MKQIGATWEVPQAFLAVLKLIKRCRKHIFSEICAEQIDFVVSF